MAFDYQTQDPNAGYTPEQFGQWYQSQFGQAADPNVMQQIGAQVGPAAGPNGNYSAAQWQQGQQIAQQPGMVSHPAPFFSEFQAPKFEAGPEFQAPAPFQAPTMAQAQADPGYQFALNQGMDALQNSQAARGMARTGGALKDLMAYGQQAAAQQYDKVYDRAAQQHNQAYAQGRDAWSMNQQQREGAFDRNYRGASDAFNSKFRGQELSFQDLFNRWNVKTNITAQEALARD